MVWSFQIDRLLPKSAMMMSRALPEVEAAARRAARSRAAVFAQPQAPLFAAVAIAALVILAISTTRSVGLIAALWGAGGLAVAAWLRAGRGNTSDLAYGGLLATGFFAGNLLVGNPLPLAGMFVLINMMEVGLAVLLVRRFASGVQLGTVTGAARFLLFGAVLSTLPSAIMAGVLLEQVNAQPFLQTFQSWWLGHALGVAIIAPFVLSLTRRNLTVFATRWRIAEALVLLAAVTAAAMTLFAWAQAPIGFIILPLLLLVTVRFRVLGATTAILIVAGVSIIASVSGLGPLRDSGMALEDRVILAQTFLIFACLPILLVAAVLEERDRFAARARAGQLRAEKASEGKSRLLANVAHEIKSPVGGVIGIGELWSSGQLGPVTPTQREMADMLVKTARQVETLAHDLLDVARAESGAVQIDLRPVDACGVIEDVRRAAAMRPEARDLRFEVAIEHDSLIVMADSVRLTQVLGNLASNAVKYGASGGVILFRAGRAGDNIRIEVVDRGPGLSEEKQAQLFEPFNRLGLERSAVEGHGIGLALAKRLTELQGGQIGVDSTPGQGATFWIDLPAA